MSTILSRILTSFVLMVWGTVLTWFYFSGKVQAYLHPTFQIYPAISGIILILMACVVLIFGFPECCNGENCAHTHGKLTFGRIFAFVILIFPIFVAASTSPGQFGATAVMNRGYVDNISQLPGAQKALAKQQPFVEPPLPGENPSTQPKPSDSDNYLPKNAKGQLTLQTIDLLYAAEEPSMRKDFENKEVELIGQFMPLKVKNPTGSRFNLIRMYIVCCAADARPVAINIQAPKGEDFKDMSWVKVVGKAEFPLEGGRHTPLIVASSIEKCDPPSDKFLY
ncbi:MAG: TIGR03943 family protein [Chthoniobacterales bacterium]